MIGSRKPTYPKTRTKAVVDARPKGAKRGGGRAASGGFEYEHRYGAYLATRILGGGAAPEAWGLPAHATLVEVLIEQDAPIDDVVCATSHGGLAFAQVKKSLRLDVKKGSEFRKVVRAMVELFTNFGRHLEREGRPGRKFDHARDRIVLAIGGGSNARDLAEVCDSARSPKPFAKPQRTKKVESARKILLKSLRESWLEISAAPATDADLQSIIGATYVHECYCDEGGLDEDRALERLQQIVLPSGKSKLVWDCLIRAFQGASGSGDGFDRKRLVETVEPIARVLS